jgi:hypothetical protein
VGDADALGTAIVELVNDDERRREMAENCRRVGVIEKILLRSSCPELFGPLRLNPERELSCMKQLCSVSIHDELFPILSKLAVARCRLGRPGLDRQEDSA